MGIVAPKGHVLPSKFYMSKNEEWIKKLSRLAGIPYYGQNFNFVASTMFYFKPRALRPLLWLPIDTKDFESEPIGLDGSLAHAMERFIGLLVESRGYKILEVGEDTWDSSDPLNYPFAIPTKEGKPIR